MHRRRLIDANTKLSVPGLKFTASSISLVFFIAASDDPFPLLLSSFPKLPNLNFVASKPIQSIKNTETTGPPAFSRPCHLSAEKLGAAKE